ncbi:MAG: hypothetical protein IPM64_11630 [Phycisphaerales bacterium]|nr:hypothetical protein [Phycisphaerales bacterium]
MLYAALAFWLIVLIFSAAGVYTQWCRLLPVRSVNLILLPGTLISQLGLVAGMLMSGQTVRNTSLLGGGDDAGPQSDPPQEARIPVLGPILVGLMPVLACLTALWLAAWLVGGRMTPGATGIALAAAIPTSFEGVWGVLHALLESGRRIIDSCIGLGLPDWRSVLMLYLAICLVVRMSPPEAHLRGAIAAIGLVAALLGLLSLIWSGGREAVLSAWPMLSFCVALAVALLLITLAIRGVVGLGRILIRGA